MSITEILTGMYEVTDRDSDTIQSSVETLRKKFAKFYKLVCKFDFNTEINVAELERNTYKYFLDGMIDLTKKYTINNIADWVLIDNASKLYCINGKEENADILQLEFYQDFRQLLFEVFKKNHKLPVDRELLKTQSESQEIYFSLYGQLRKISIDHEKQSRLAGLAECSMSDLQSELEHLKELEENGCESMTRKDIIMQIIDVENVLIKLYSKNTRAYKVRIEEMKTDYKKYKGKYLKEVHHIGKQNGLFIDYLKRSLWEEQDVFPYELDPNEKDMFDRCLRKYKDKNVELIVNIIEETRKEIKEEQNQMDTNL